MKKLLPLFFLSFFMLTGCTKKNASDDKPKYYLSFKLNDSNIKHNFPTYSSLKANATIPGTYEFMISSNSDDHKNNFVFNVFRAGSIPTGTYTTNDNDIADASLTLFNNLAIDKIYSIYTTGRNPEYFSVTLTEITNNHFKGTFSGTYMFNDDRTDSVRITDGEFFVKRHN
jgi:hypothetical protein